jgi:hypothetical protein
MFGVELYATARQLVLLDGLSRREVARRLRISRDTVSKMCRYSGAARLRADEAGSVAEAWTVDRGDRRDSRRRRDGSGQAAAYGQANLATALRRARLCGRLYDCEGLRPQSPGPAPGGVRSPGSPARPCSDRLRRSGWRHQRPAVNAESILHVSAAFGRDFREGLSGGDNGGVARRRRLRLFFLRRRRSQCFSTT